MFAATRTTMAIMAMSTICLCACAEEIKDTKGDPNKIITATELANSRANKGDSAKTGSQCPLGGICKTGDLDKSGTSGMTVDWTKPDAPYVFMPNPAQLGDMVFDEKREFTIQIRNREDKPLTIKKVRSGCPCLYVDSFTDKPIPAGESGLIKCHIVADPKEVEAHKVFYIHTDHFKEPIGQVGVNVRFVKPEGAKGILSQDSFDFGSVSKTDSKRLAVVRVMNFGDKPMKITSITNNVKGLEIKADSDEPIPQSKGVTLRAILDPAQVNAEALAAGKLAEEIFIFTDAPFSPALTMKVNANFTAGPASKPATTAADTSVIPIGEAKPKTDATADTSKGQAACTGSCPVPAK